ncbi:UNVERIFIED_CONTAM: hypothetical protein PYX00_011390 [Menopon gallinae]|uniref:Uncharacterized protein n=1 Tax=Menopon gallinae TaxID=328185 RepID=A0AAW2H7K6_9NEOP
MTNENSKTKQEKLGKKIVEEEKYKGARDEVSSTSDSSRDYDDEDTVTLETSTEEDDKDDYSDEGLSSSAESSSYSNEDLDNSSEEEPSDEITPSMRIKKTSVAFLINMLTSTYVVWTETPHYKLWKLNKAITHEIRDVYSSFCLEFAQVFRGDGVLALSVHDRFYRVLSAELGGDADEAAIVFVRCRARRFVHSHMHTPQDVHDYAKANPKCTYFVLSPHAIRAFRTLDSMGEVVYYLHNLFDVLEKRHLPVFFKNVLESLHRAGLGTRSTAPVVDNSDILIRVSESLLAATYHIELRSIGWFAHTVYTGAHDEQFRFYADMEHIFTKSVRAVKFPQSKSSWLERYIKDIIEYLHLRDMISTTALCAHPDMIPSLFPFKFVSLSSSYFKDNETVHGGLCFGTVLEKSHLVGLVDRETFKKYNECLGTLHFTGFVRMGMDADH